MTRVLIAIPALDMCATDFTMSLAALCTYNATLRPPPKLALACAKGSIIPHSRNLLAAQAVESGASHLLFLDSDMTFPPNALERLLAHKVPIVGADYVRRVEPHDYCGRVANTTATLTGLNTMLTMPFGCILIQTDVFKRLKKPWFSYYEGGTDAETLSEDTGFCNSVRSLLTMAIWRDVSLTAEVGHVGTKVYRPVDRPL